MQTVFKKNIKSLESVNSSLAKELLKIEQLEVFEPSNSIETITDLNIFDHKNQTYIYDNPKLELAQQLQEFKVYENYRYLYLYGIGNGLFLLSLLLNHEAQRVVLFEDNIELIYIAFHFHDYSDFLKSKKIQILKSTDIDFEFGIKIFDYQDSIFCIDYFEIFTSEYYKRFSNYKNLKVLFTQIIEYLKIRSGNMINDSLKGIEQSFNNIELMFKSKKLSNFQNLYKNKTAIIVSTGPSLHKQLKLLKSIESKAIIISVDASYPILYRHGIIPDFVVSMERDEPTSHFFKDIPYSFQEKSDFILVSLQHKSVFDAIKKEQQVIVFRNLKEYRYFEYDDFGYLANGHSAANMALDFAYHIGVSKTVLIGQDLAFAKDGSTHTKGHIFETNDLIEQEKKDGRLYELEAYGSEGVVKSHVYWVLFKNALERFILKYSDNMLCINATEGGAKIYNCIEDSFLNITNVLKKLDDKDIIKVDQISKEESAKLLKSFNKKNTKLEKDYKKYNHILKNIINKIKKFDKYGSVKSLLLYNEILSVKKEIKNIKTFHDFISPIIASSLDAQERELAYKYAQCYKDDYERAETIIKFSYENLKLMDTNSTLIMKKINSSSS